MNSRGWASSNAAMYRPSLTHGLSPALLFLFACSNPATSVVETPASAPSTTGAKLAESRPFCPGLAGWQADGTAPGASLDAARAVLAAREADLLECSGVESVWLGRTDGDGVALVVWQELPPGARFGKRPLSHAPVASLDGVPVMLWERGACNADSAEVSRPIPFARGSVAVTGEALRSLDAVDRYARLHPEFATWSVRAPSGEADRAQQRAEAVAQWLNAKGIHTGEVGVEPRSGQLGPSDEVRVSAEAEHQCGSQSVYFR